MEGLSNPDSIDINFLSEYLKYYNLASDDEFEEIGQTFRAVWMNQAERLPIYDPDGTLVSAFMNLGYRLVLLILNDFKPFEALPANMEPDFCIEMVNMQLVDQNHPVLIDSEAYFMGNEDQKLLGYGLISSVLHCVSFY